MILDKALFCYVLIHVNFNVIAGGPSKGIQDGALSNTSDLAADLDNWMAKLPPALRAVPIKNLAIPGSHDSFTSQITGASKVSADGETIMRFLSRRGASKQVLANWSKAQNLNVTEQLQAGIRYFHLRPCKSNFDGYMYLCHSMYSTMMHVVLRTINAYLNNHPQEVVIIDCGDFVDFTAYNHIEAIDIITNILGDKMVPYPTSTTLMSLEYLASKNKQVIGIYRDSSRNTQRLLWPGVQFPSVSHTTMDSSVLFPNLDKDIRTRAPVPWLISQCILSPLLDDILGNLSGSIRQTCAVDFESERNDWISNQTPAGNGVNIIAADYIDLSDNLFSKTVINLNTKLLD